MLNTLLIIIISSLIGFTLLTASFCLPNGSVQSNAKISSIMLTHEGLYPEKVEGIKATEMDNYTDALMINSASFDYGGCTVFDKAARINRFEVDWSDDPIVHLYERYNDEENICNIKSYGRYWHGYITLLRPLLMICNYSWIRFIQFVLHISLLFAFATLLKAKTGLLNTINFLTVYLIFACFVLPYSLQLSQIFNIALFFGSILLYKYDYLKKKSLLDYFFLIIGIFASYFDLLTYPIAILGINLIIITLLDKGLKPSIIIKNICMWFIGYGGMWFMKWVLASFVLKENVFIDAYKAIVFRSSNVTNGMKVTLYDTMLLNFDYINNKITFLLFILTMITNFVYIYIYIYIRIKNSDLMLIRHLTW
ncbi:MAG: hypothetical protein PT938_07670 [Solobacterium sp.]|nr:hypothetical protein [Solobacterium sp.]